MLLRPKIQGEGWLEETSRNSLIKRDHKGRVKAKDFELDPGDF